MIKYEKPQLVKLDNLVANGNPDCANGSVVVDVCPGGSVVTPGCAAGGVPMVECGGGGNYF